MALAVLVGLTHCCKSSKDSCQVPSAAVPTQVKEHITRLAKKGATPSSIGVTLRDSHGIAQVGHTAGRGPDRPYLAALVSSELLAAHRLHLCLALSYTSKSPGFCALWRGSAWRLGPIRDPHLMLRKTSSAYQWLSWADLILFCCRWAPSQGPRSCAS